MGRPKDDVKSGAGFKYIFGQETSKTTDDCYKALAACAIFQACKDYKAWIVAKHFTLKVMPEIIYDDKVSMVLWKLVQSPRRHIWKDTGNAPWRADICMKRIVSICEKVHLSRGQEYLDRIRAFAMLGSAARKAVKKQVFILFSATSRRYVAAQAVIQGKTERFMYLDGFFESEQFDLLSGGLNGAEIKREIERQAAEKIRRKEMGLPFDYDEEEEDDEES